jgi:hypothetical protein
MFALLHIVCVSNCWKVLCLRLTDLSIVHITKNCKNILDLNLSGCKVLLVSYAVSNLLISCSIFLVTINPEDADIVG